MPLRRLAAFLIIFPCCEAATAGFIVNEPTVSLGRVAAGKPLEHLFHFRIDGGKSVEVTDVRPSCGCLRSDMKKNSFQPGESGTIPLSIHTLGQTPGPHRYQLTVTVRDPAPRLVVLVADVEIYREVTVEPANLIIYTSGRGEPIRQPVTIRDERPNGLDITHVTTSSARITSRIPTERQGSLHDPQVRRVELVIAGNFPAGQSEEQVEVHTSDPSYPVLRIPVTVVKQGSLRAFPDRIRVSREELANAPVSRTMFLKENQGRPILISKADSDHPWIHCDIPAGASSRPSITVSFDRQSLTESVSTSIRVTIVEPTPMQLLVPVVVD